MAKNVAVKLDDFHAIKQIILAEEIHLVVVGPEAPLVAGLVDFIRRDPELTKVLVVGPKARGAQLEGSKAFAKDFMIRHGIPTAKYKSFSSAMLANAHDYLDTCSPPYVLKADGLAAGKGVIISESKEEAHAVLDHMLKDHQFGKASEQVVIEEYLTGIELSVFIITDGDQYVILPEAKDYKRIGEGDTGPNTGGMGAVSPVPFASPEFMKKVDEQIISTTIAGLKKDNIPFSGFIFFGLINVNDDPYVIEYNVRMGDPETQAVLPRINSDFLELLERAASGNLLDYKLEISEEITATVVLVSGGYPGSYDKGNPISIKSIPGNIEVFHAGTFRDKTGTLTTAGGRVLAVTGKGETLEQALAQSYAQADSISWPDQYMRKDIGQDLM